VDAEGGVAGRGDWRRGGWVGRGWEEIREIGGEELMVGGGGRGVGVGIGKVRGRGWG